MDNRAIIERNKEVAARFLAGTHSADLADVAIIDSTVSPEIVCHGFPGGDPFDHESYKAFFRTFRRSFGDMAWTVDAIVADETYVSARWRIEATHCGDFAGVKAGGRRVRIEGMVLYRMRDGLIAETWLHIDQLSLLAQIGAIPALAA